MKKLTYDIPSNINFEKYDRFHAVVTEETKSGYKLELTLQNGRKVQAFGYGGFNVGDLLDVSIKKIEPNKLPEICAESVIEYAADREQNHSFYAA